MGKIIWKIILRRKERNNIFPLFIYFLNLEIIYFLLIFSLEIFMIWLW
jgi:hypothetical protein